MSSEPADSDLECCEYCGLPIEKDGQRCPAIEDGPCKTTQEVLEDSEVVV